MPDQTITLTLYEKKDNEPFIKIGYKDIAGSDKEVQLTGDQESDNKKMIDLFSDLLPEDWIEQYRTITSLPIVPVSEAESNAEKLKNTKSGTLYSDKLSIDEIISALSTDKLKIMNFNIHVIKSLLNKLTNRDYSKKIKKEILTILTTDALKEDFDSGIILEAVKTDILRTAQNPTTYEGNNNNLIDQVFTPEFVKKYEGNITTWGREVLLIPNIITKQFSPMSTFSKGGNNSTQKTHKINNNKTAKKNK